MFVPPQPSRASVLLAALARQTLRPIVRGIRPGARDDQIRRALAIVDRRTRYLHVPLSTPLRAPLCTESISTRARPNGSLLHTGPPSNG
ncbi:hypothetical protein I552_7080 [Mycobacterium xenopi 3993]|nr:hypothetical protein I552_7080 [Mycobacterium xenopi 3993]